MWQQSLVCGDFFGQTVNDYFYFRHTYANSEILVISCLPFVSDAIKRRKPEVGTLTDQLEVVGNISYYQERDVVLRVGDHFC